MNIKIILLCILGFLSLILGAVGLFLPLLPTTPFVLIAGLCFSSSNPKLYGKMIKNKIFNEYMINYQNKTGISKRTKIKSILFLWITFCAWAIIFSSNSNFVILFLVGVLVSIHILLIKTKIL